MKFVSMLDEELVLEKIPGSSRQEVYSAMLTRLAEYAELDLDIPEIISEMVEREDNEEIIFPNVAMPHVRLNELHDLFIVVALPENPEALNSKNPPAMIFMTLIGNEMSDVYLKTISTLARYLSKKDQAEDLINAARGGKAALWNYLLQSNIKLREIVTAEDVMSPVEGAIKQDAPLSDAFNCFNNTHLRFMPVVDDQNRLVGELSARKVVKSFIPDYVYMMDNVNFMNDFSVFNKIFESEHCLPVAQFMHKEPARAALNTSLFQLTVLLTKQDGGAVYIVDNDNVLRGIFSIENVISKVLRG